MVLRREQFLWSATAVLLTAAAFRLVDLAGLPPGLAQDEVLNADIAAFIREGYHALFFREGYGHEPLYHYFAVPFQILFGDNVMAIRLPSVYLGMVLVAASMRWARRRFGGLVALVAGAGLAISWWPIIFSRIGIRPILVPVLLVAAAWFWKRPWLAGLFLGLSFYSYTGARIIFLLPILFAVGQRLGGRRTIGLQVWWRWLVIVLFAFVLVAAPMQVTLMRDPSLQQRVGQLAGPLETLRVGDVGPIWQTTLATLGVFSFTGDPRWTYMVPGRPLFDWVTAVFFYGGLLLALWRWRQPRYMLLLTWLMVGLLPSAVTPQAPSTIRMIGALPAVYVLLGLAVAEFVTRWRHWRPPRRETRLLLGLLLSGLLLLNGARTLRSGFVEWPAALETRLKYQTVFADMAAHWQVHGGSVPVLADGFYEPIDADSFRRMLGQDVATRWVQTGSEVAGAVVLPAGRGENGRFYVPEFAQVPTDLLRFSGIGERPLYRSRAVPSFAVYALPAAPGLPEMSAPVSLDGGLTLIGYEILPEAEGRPLRLFTIWRVDGSLPPDLSLFVHVLADETTVVAQHDGLDTAVERLQPGDLVVQRHVVPLTNIAAGEYILSVGAYERGNGRRLTVSGSEADTIRLLAGVGIDGE